MRIRSLLVAAMVAACLTATTAAACVQVGVYQDDPAATLPALNKQTGGHIRVVSTYLTAGKPLDPRLIRLVNVRRLTLMVSWLPDGGKEGAKQPKFRLKNILKGRYDKSLRTLGATLRKSKRFVIFRPMPEGNTPWHAWSGTVNGNTPKQYVAAWRRVRAILRKSGGAKVRFLWAPYVQSIPNTPPNAIKAYFPGRKHVDVVGTVGYNFGARNGLQWTDPTALFSGAYKTIEALARRPFWVSETGSTATGGDKAGWIASLSTLKKAMPKLQGLVWFDVRERTGDFRIRSTKKTTAAFKTFLRKGACR